MVFDTTPAVNPSAYLVERRSRPTRPAAVESTAVASPPTSPPASPPPPADESLSEHSDTPKPHAVRRTAAITVTAATTSTRSTFLRRHRQTADMSTTSIALAAMAATRQLGKAPILFDCSPSGLKDFLRSAKSYFRKQKDFDGSDKIAVLGEGLMHFVELKSWYNSNETRCEAMKYDDFVAELHRRALPRNYVWDAKAEIRASQQGQYDYEEWSDAMRAQHLALGEGVMSTKEFVEHLLFNMDAELSIILRRGSSLKGTGLLDEETAALAVSTTAAPQIYASVVDYDRFNDEARLEWSKIAARRESNAQQIKSLAKKAASGSSSRQLPSRNSERQPTPSQRAGSGRDDRPRPPPLTVCEKQYLREKKGCFKCRKTYARHESPECTVFAAADHVIKIPAGWVPANASDTAAAAAAPVKITGKINALRIADSEEDDSDDYHLPYDSSDADTDNDGCAFPPLSVRVGSSQRNRVVQSLADSGSDYVLISDELVEDLGLTKVKLPVPKGVKLALEGEKNATQHQITEFVRVPIELKNNTWRAGVTSFLVAKLEKPFDIILGNPFLGRHRISVVPGKNPQLLRKREGLPDHDLFDEPYGPPTAEEAGFAREDVDREMRERAAKLLEDFDDLFPSALPPLTADYLARCKTRHRIRLVDESKVHNQRGFAVPRKWRESWKRMLEEHLAAGRLRPSTSPYASAAFVTPKKDKTVDPRWVNDSRSLNSNTVKDRTPLPVPDVVLSDAAQAKIWGKIDMTNAFFQTPLAEEDIEKAAIKTPWGLFEWTVMPQGLCNAPATHQARVNEALRHLIGVCCEAFVDDIIIYSNTLKEHKKNCRAVLDALRNAGLFCSRKKTDLFTTRTEFLGHIISRDSLEADRSKVEKIENWPRPRTVSQVRGFLGLVQYLRKFVPGLAEYMSALTPLTKKGLADVKALWGKREEKAFMAIKKIVASLPVLQPLRHDSDEPIWLMTDASKVGVGAVLLQGTEWQTARPCGFYSRQYIAAEKNYPTHEQELLAIVAALKAWRIDLLGTGFKVLTDHDTLKHLQTQPTLSKRQARWIEVLADYDYELSYVPGKKNVVADSLSRFSFPHGRGEEPALAVRGISHHSLSRSIVERIKKGYESDSFCQQIRESLDSSSAFSLREELIYFEHDRLVVPKDLELRETLLHDAHDALGHLGFRKTLSRLSSSFFFPGMRQTVEKYVESCDGCQRHKSRTTRRAGKLHSLPIPPRPFSDIALDFVGPLPKSDSMDMLLTITDCLTGYTRVMGCRSTDGAKEIAQRVFENWFALFGLPERMVSDRDKLFTSKFWGALHKRVGVKLQMSTSFHPETDGRSKRSNKTIVQVLRNYVSRQQTDWHIYLPLAEYAVNSAVNDSTRKTPFEVVLGYTPSLLPSSTIATDVAAVEDLVEERKVKIQEARDALAAAKMRQASQANKTRGDEQEFAVGDLVMVDSSDRRARYKSRNGDGRAAKLFARWDGPYKVVEARPATSTYRLLLPPDDRAHPVFHRSKLKAYRPNNSDDFPARHPPRPEPIDVEGEEEYIVERIVDEKGRGLRRKFLVKWLGYPDDKSTWEPLRAVKDTVALDEWENRVGEGH
ncbi:hypothetical protein JCM10908_004099 [Rhodotorula pacifica]|uniref:uncharacterized protein n=1 Tax=Rhodotorula pacifica TaxID=1495444 RepID=UPI00317CADAD